MIITLTGFQMAMLGFDLAVLVFAIFAARKLWELDQFKKGLIAHAKAAPSPPTAELIKQWMKMYKDLPEGSPKKTAYQNRLIEIGALERDKKGDIVKVAQSSGD